MLVKIEHECDDGLMLQLTFEYTKGYQEVRYPSNGDPGYPGEPDGVDLVEICFKQGKMELKLAPWLVGPDDWAKGLEEMYRDEVIEAATEREDY